jgi:hypothetical protein
MLMVDVAVAMTLLVLVLIPISFSFFGEQRLCQSYYFRALATEIVDGEIEVLAAGEWRVLPEGSQPYVVKSKAAENLPVGQFTFSRKENALRLEWRPEAKNKGGIIIREAKGK